VHAETFFNIGSIRKTNSLRNGLGKRNHALPKGSQLQERTIKEEVIQIKDEQANVPQHLESPTAG